MFPVQDDVQSRSVPVATWTIIALNGVAFLYELSLPRENIETFVFFLGMVPARLSSHPVEWVTLFTCMFLHGGWMHFLGNMWSLYLFGDNVEDRMGPARYLIFYLLCGIMAGLAHYVFNPLSTIPVIGASGAIAGVFGAYLLLFPTARVITLVPILFIPLFFEIPAVVFLGVWFLTQLFSGTLAIGNQQDFTGIAWWAHIGGFVGGMVLLPIFKKSSAQYRHFHEDEFRPW